jgi:hypothetical protein
MKQILALYICALACLPATNGRNLHNARLLSAQITGEDGQPLAGVSVSLQHHPARTVADQNGRFTLDVPEGALIVLNYAGCPTAVYTREEIEEEFRYSIVFHDHILLPEAVIAATKEDWVKCGGTRCPFPDKNSKVSISLQGQNWQYYPNPTRDRVRVFTEIANGFIEVYSSSGTRVARIEVMDNQTVVDLDRFSAGVYFMFYEHNNRVEPIGQVALIKG